MHVHRDRGKKTDGSFECILGLDLTMPNNACDKVCRNAREETVSDDDKDE